LVLVLSLPNLGTAVLGTGGRSFSLRHKCLAACGALAHEELSLRMPQVERRT